MRLAALIFAGIFAGILASSAALAEAPLPDYEIVPLTKADVDFYMDILRAAAAHNAHLTGDDKAAVDFTVNMQKHPPKTPKGDHLPTQGEMDQMTRNANLAARAAELASYDDKIAEQRGVPKRYEAVKNEIETVLPQITGEGGSCGGDCTPPGGFSAAVLARAKKEEVASKADLPLIKSHVAEIKALKKQIGGFMFGGH
ncbi:MAG TPA: hypothetical protein VGF56_07905 [Rhizomicrobium sp.]|jgi:hypothetical protein